jgi:hypothetical protein
MTQITTSFCPVAGIHPTNMACACMHDAKTKPGLSCICLISKENRKPRLELMDDTKIMQVEFNCGMKSI